MEGNGDGKEFCSAAASTGYLLKADSCLCWQSCQLDLICKVTNTTRVDCVWRVTNTTRVDCLVTWFVTVV